MPCCFLSFCIYVELSIWCSSSILLSAFGIRGMLEVRTFVRVVCGRFDTLPQAEPLLDGLAKTGGHVYPRYRFRVARGVFIIGSCSSIATTSGVHICSLRLFDCVLPRPTEVGDRDERTVRFHAFRNSSGPFLAHSETSGMNNPLQPLVLCGETSRRYVTVSICWHHIFCLTRYFECRSVPLSFLSAGES